ncbi:MAG: class I SAM-dependent methyltransferase [Sulfurospirillaceae bacterium]|nr:class I SAM-dependent methyltransferase [Sulfurospirillaceae bacterium]
MMNKKCIICGFNEFDVLLNYQFEKVVSSDNKILNKNFKLLKCKKCQHVQKQLDKSLSITIDKIYTHYEAYSLTNGNEEQRKDGNNISVNRSSLILKNIKKNIKKNGKLLDIGTGTGVFLQEFSRQYNWELYGCDVHNNIKSEIQELANFKKLFIANHDIIPSQQFNIISTIHVLEHIFDLDLFLNDIKNKLTKDGFLLLQVPNISENIFDIFIIDHVSHFYYETLHYLLKQYFPYVYFPKLQIDREITAIASKSKINKIETLNVLESSINLKTRINNLLNYLSNDNDKVAIFGTSPPALFCASLLNFKFDCFIDESCLKFGNILYGKKIKSPQEINDDMKILFPYSKKALNNILKRYPSYKFICLENII